MEVWVRKVCHVVGQSLDGRDVSWECSKLSSYSEGGGCFVEGIVSVDHPFPDRFSGELCFEAGEHFRWAHLVDLPGVNVGEPLFRAI